MFGRWISKVHLQPSTLHQAMDSQMVPIVDFSLYSEDQKTFVSVIFEVTVTITIVLVNRDGLVAHAKTVPPQRHFTFSANSQNAELCLLQELFSA